MPLVSTAALGLRPRTNAAAASNMVQALGKAMKGLKVAGMQNFWQL